MILTFDREIYGKLLAEFQPKVITSEEEYDFALEAVEKLMGCKNRSPEQTAILQLLVSLIEEYESKNYSMRESSPHEILEHLMEARGIKQSDLVGIIGSKGVVSEIVNGKRGISKAQAKALAEFFHVSLELFI
ncbi:MAG: helix-turn-helix domain-containing protein [Chlorogloeopsis fritschii C42_A2020_084]|jgi:HTH-type transcriptional regulator / antitoxin HigA|uniref:helix-turn-helix domain-containing protein n=1 Tax=Chlorogloeopsis fritschii TaxID=1124 RepID=UPI001A102529|nr:helix-turn-helix domain-containing protein [Chlorogloeopsis fritschii]MBF2007474.1 helix-turn-helix domain-containing protein [Chlorogloeopsis fritschii C42_A2020_084]